MEHGFKNNEKIHWRVVIVVVVVIVVIVVGLSSCRVGIVVVVVCFALSGCPLRVVEFSAARCPVVKTPKGCHDYRKEGHANQIPFWLILRSIMKLAFRQNRHGKSYMKGKTIKHFILEKYKQLNYQNNYMVSWKLVKS